MAQEAFLRAHRALGEFRGDARLSTWLYAITSRLCLNRLASGERRMARQRADDVADLVAAKGTSPAATSSAASARRRFTGPSPSCRRTVESW